MPTHVASPRSSSSSHLQPAATRSLLQVIDIIKPILEDVVAKQPMLDAIRVEELDLGELPLRLAGLKVYDTKDDEVIIEAPIQWGSAIKVPPLTPARTLPPTPLAHLRPPLPQPPRL